MSKTLMFGANADNAQLDAGSLIGVTTITPKRARRLLEWIDRVRALYDQYNEGVYCLEIFDSAVSWYQPPGELEDRVVQQLIDDTLDAGIIEIPDQLGLRAPHFETLLTPESTECNTVCVLLDGVYWTMLLDDSEIRYQTGYVSEKLLQDVAAM